MKIRPQQMTAFKASMQRHFEQRAVAHLRQAFPGSVGTASDEELLAVIRPAVEQARGYGIKTEDDLLAYLDFEFMYGPGFPDRFAEAREMLAREDLDPLGKLRGLDDWEAFSRPQRQR